MSDLAAGEHKAICGVVVDECDSVAIAREGPIGGEAKTWASVFVSQDNWLSLTCC